MSGCGWLLAPAPEGLLTAPLAQMPTATGVFDHGGGHGQVAFDGTRIDGTPGHLGWDWGAAQGTPVVAAADGVVVASGLRAPFRCPLDGRTVTDQQVVQLEHRARGVVVRTTYDHLHTRAVAVGEAVVRGEVIGRVGATGCARGPHLHFAVEARQGDAWTAIDPFDPPAWVASGPLWTPGAAPPWP